MSAELAPQDEITIQEFNIQIHSLVRFVQAIIRQYFKGLRRYWLLMTGLLVIITAGICGVFYYKGQVYTGKASYAYTELRRRLYGESIDRLNDLLQAHAYDQLQKELPQLRPEQISNLREIKATNIYGSLLSDDITENDFKIFYVTVSTTDHTVFDSLDVILDHYLNNNIAVHETLMQTKDKYESALINRQQQLNTIDSLLLLYTHQPNDSIANITTTLFAQSRQLNEEMSFMHSVLQDLRAVKLQGPFLVSSILPKYSRVKIALIIIATFVAVSLLLILILSNAKKTYVP